MVNSELVNYISEGKKRGFSVNLLKKKLMEGGYSQSEVDEAERVVENSGVPEVTQTDKKINGDVTKNEEVTKNQSEVKGNLPLMKVGGWTGWILVCVLLAFGILAVGFPQIANGILSEKIIFIASLIVLTGLTFFYYLGFVKVGKNTNEGKINAGSWLIVVGMLFVLVISVASNFVSFSLQTRFPIIAMSFLVAALVGLVGQFVFSWGLLKINRQVRFAKLAGIFNVIMFFAAIGLFVSFALLSYEAINVISNLGAKSVSLGIEEVFGQISDSSKIFLSTMIAGTYFILILKIVFDSLVLRSGSKRFED